MGRYNQFLAVGTGTENREEISVPIPLGTDVSSWHCLLPL